MSTPNVLTYTLGDTQSSTLVNNSDKIPVEVKQIINSEGLKAQTPVYQTNGIISCKDIGINEYTRTFVQAKGKAVGTEDIRKTTNANKLGLTLDLTNPEAKRSYLNTKYSSEDDTTEKNKQAFKKLVLILSQMVKTRNTNTTNLLYYAQYATTETLV
jgi:hypothetical protein